MVRWVGGVDGMGRWEEDVERTRGLKMMGRKNETIRDNP